MVNEFLVSFSYGFWGEAITSISYTLGNTDKLSTGYGGYQAEGHFSAITFDGHLHKKNVLVILIIKRRLEKTREKEDEEEDLKKKKKEKKAFQLKCGNTYKNIFNPKSTRYIAVI